MNSNLHPLAQDLLSNMSGWRHRLERGQEEIPLDLAVQLLEALRGLWEQEWLDDTPPVVQRWATAGCPIYPDPPEYDVRRADLLMDS